MKKYFSLALLILSSCGSPKVEYTYPKAAPQIREEKIGSFVSKDDDGGFVLFGKKMSSGSSGTSKNPVNRFLWQAALENVSFMPIIVSDSTGGVITTDWNIKDSNPNERFKLNLLILGGKLQARSIKVNIFKQIKTKTGEWQDKPVPQEQNISLEDKVIARARELNIESIQ